MLKCWFSLHFSSSSFVIVGSGSYVDCGPIWTIDQLQAKCCCSLMHGGWGTFMLNFHVVGLIVSCGCFWWFVGSNLWCQLWVIQVMVGLICICELQVITVPLDSITEVNRLQTKSCCSRMHEGLRNKYARFSCWWVDYKLWVLLVIWGIKFGCRLWVVWGPVGWKQKCGSYA